MRTRYLFLVLALAVGLPFGGTAWGHPDLMNDDMVDGPVESGPHDHQHGGAGGHLPASSENVELVGSLTDLTGVAGGISDVGAWGNFAYLGAFSPECAGRPGAQGTGVHVVDISDPANPTKVAFIPAHANSYVGEGVQVFHAETDSFEGEILVHNNEGCNTSAPYRGGVSLWDVTDPTSPVALAEGVGDNSPSLSPNINGVHSSHSAMGWWVPETGRAYVMLVDNQELGDVDILDVTDPTAPVQVAETGFNSWPAAHSPLANGDTVFHHDMQIKKIGAEWKALISYWDAGWVILDVTDPSNPVFEGDSDYPTPDPLTGFGIPEGNGHQAWWSSNNKFILGTDEDFSPTRTSCEITTGSSAGPTPCGEFGWTPSLQSTYPDGLEGVTVYGGLGCDAASVPPASTAPGTGLKIAVFSRGDCFFSTKVENGQNAGFDAVAIGQSHGGTRAGLLPDGFICGGQGHDFDEQIPAICIGHRAMHLLFGSTPSYTGPEGADITVGTVGDSIFAKGGVFDGWGYVHLLDATTLQEIDSYAVPEALDPAFQDGFGNLTVHEVQTDPRANVNLAYFSYYDAGFRVAKFGMNGIEEVGHYIDADGNDFWGIEPVQLKTGASGRGGQPFLLLSDRDSGLWIFRYTG